MALRPYNGNAMARGASEPRGSYSGQARGSREPRLLAEPVMPFHGGRDPFAEFGSLDTFGGMSLFGPGGGPGGIMKRFDELSRGMMQGFGDFQADGPGSMLGKFGAQGPGGDGQYSCQTFAMSSRMGPDGKVHTERYASSDTGHRGQRIRESQQAYSNSSTGVDKLGFERQLNDRARKVVKERDRNTMEERSTEMFRGMDESGRGAFDRDFQSKAHHLPRHGNFGGAGLQHALAAGMPPPHRALGDASSTRSAQHRHQSTPAGRHMR
mmetsp:Transcript_26042/g.60834  ORF Transcript_26042/g.60834 Transcript_26042/m.60834 type:complete len:267 (+) Transcript_26042:108-908(+)